jgi:hypothetical protein
MMERGEKQRQAVFGTEYKSVVPASSSSGGTSSSSSSTRETPWVQHYRS